MARNKLLVSILAIILVISIYKLPKVVVENETQVDLPSHEFVISPDDANAIAALKNALANPEIEKSSIFADSLTRYYMKYGLLDSAETIVKRYFVSDSSLQVRKIAINRLYDLFQRSASGDVAAQKAIYLRPLIEQAILEEPGNLSLKNKLAMTIVTSETPMVGISMLREIVAEDPNNREALINLGLLSIRSGQFDRAIGRFETLLGLDSSDHESKLYLGLALQETGAMERASSLLTQITRAEDVDPAIRQAALEYLERK